MNRSADSNCIVDKFFYESYKKFEEKKSKSLSYYVVRTFSLLVAAPINYAFLEQRPAAAPTPFALFLLLALAYTLLRTLQAAYFYCAYVRSRTRLTTLATQFHHSLLANHLKAADPEEPEDDLANYERQEDLGLKVSTTYYDFENMEKVSDVPEETRAMRESGGCKSVGSALESSMACSGFSRGLFMASSVAVFSWGLALGSVVPLTDLQHSLLEMVLITELMFQPRVYAIALVVALAPVGVAVGCVYCCCCGPKKVKLPAPVRATPEIVGKCGECSICFQDIALEEKVAVLPCSELHVFHYGCIEGWGKVKPSCPNCRHQLD